MRKGDAEQPSTSQVGTVDILRSARCQLSSDFLDRRRDDGDEVRLAAAAIGFAATQVVAHASLQHQDLRRFECEPGGIKAQPQDLNWRSTVRIIRRLREVTGAIEHVGGEETEHRYVRRAQPLPQLGAHAAKLDAMLAENVAKPARDRLTFQPLYEALRLEGYASGYDAIKRYGRAWERRHAAVAARPLHRLCEGATTSRAQGSHGV